MFTKEMAEQADYFCVSDIDQPGDFIGLQPWFSPEGHLIEFVLRDTSENFKDSGLTFSSMGWQDAVKFAEAILFAAALCKEAEEFDASQAA